VGKFIDLTGQKFGKLTALSYKTVRQNNHRSIVVWECACDCGNIVSVRSSSLTSGNSRSCGCHHKATSPINGSKYQYNGTNIPSLTRKTGINNTTGHKGVYKCRDGRYAAQINLSGKRTYLGRYNNVNDAIKARKIAEENIFVPIIDEFKSQEVGD
jgi:hypothetical protein